MRPENICNFDDLLVGLRELVERLELDPPLTGDKFLCAPEVGIHNITDRAVLASWVRLMDSPEPNQSRNGTCWVSGSIGGIKVTCFYAAGLLGQAKRETIREVTVEEGPDVAGLLAEFADASPATPDQSPAEVEVNL